MSCPAQSSPDRVMNSPSPNYTRADRAAPSQRAPLCCVVSPACDDASYPNLPCPRRYTRQYHVETAIGTSKYEARKRCLDLDGYAACVCVCVCDVMGLCLKYSMFHVPAYLHTLAIQLSMEEIFTATWQ
ncbi:uncharacterized protein SETTUDRAFT_163523 [Exserohilum turcica Et28A]|uniref:Uncharacterized protein n=1 Tax=Exserohilum turcicum (strain 28A) TaxID=671987 RepID=R0IHK9_EXST2|nr:uncharacterized protein SETTUDRAFT_163523 [Exserohilum turcica Et28A]EOA84635.1 hypothetical protein SETTUDRAFT_163523 [Exserohilum turcica Et28A]